MCKADQSSFILAFLFELAIISEQLSSAVRRVDADDLTFFNGTSVFHALELSRVKGFSERKKKKGVDKHADTQVSEL